VSAQLEPELLADGALLVPVTQQDGTQTMVRLEPGEQEHAAWLGYMQRQRQGGPPPVASTDRAWWAPRDVGMPLSRKISIGLGVLSFIIAGLWYAGSLDEPLSHVGLNKNTCGQNAFGATFCGDDLRDYCERFEIRNSEACDDVRP
jgi:hypothetical protein